MKLKQFKLNPTLDQIREVAEANCNILTVERDDGIIDEYDSANLEAYSIILRESKKADSVEQLRDAINKVIVDEIDDITIMRRLVTFAQYHCTYREVS